MRKNKRVFIVHGWGGHPEEGWFPWLKKELERRGFEGNIRQLYNGDATRSNLLSYLDSVAENATRYSHFIFHYSGHGSRSGLCLGIMGLGTVTPENFYAALAKIKGKKAVILDCCHAGVFINENNKKHMPDNTLVLAASSEQGKAYEPQDWAVAGGKHMGRFTSALVRYLDNHTHRLNLRDFEREIQREFPPGFFGYYCQEPQVTGDAFTMLTVRVR